MLSTASNPSSSDLPQDVEFHKAGTLHEFQIGSYRACYSPDRSGFPVLLPLDLARILDGFAEGKTLGRLAREWTNGSSEHPNPEDRVLLAAQYFVDRGFLRPQPQALPYAPLSAPTTQGHSSLGLWLHITNDCNFDCSYCFVGRKTRVRMSPSTAEVVMDAIAQSVRSNGLQNVTVKFSGGEPTLALPLMRQVYDGLTRRLADLECALAFSVLSNGSAHNKDLIGFLSRDRVNIGVSLDCSQVAHDRHRRRRGSGAPTWNLVRSTVDALIESGKHPFVMATVTPEGADGMPSLAQWAHERHLPVRFSLVRDPPSEWTSNGRELPEAYLRLCDTMIGAFDRLFAYIAESSSFLDLGQFLQICELHFFRPASAFCCSVGANYLVFKPDGSLVPCPMMVESAGRPVTEDLLDACGRTLGSSVAGGSGEHASECLTCRWYPVCAGGCPILNWRVGGSMWGTSPFCRFFQFVIPAFLGLFATKLHQASEFRRGMISGEAASGGMEETRDE